MPQNKRHHLFAVEGPDAAILTFKTKLATFREIHECVALKDVRDDRTWIYFSLTTASPRMPSDFFHGIYLGRKYLKTTRDVELDEVSKPEATGQELARICRSPYTQPLDDESRNFKVYIRAHLYALAQCTIVSIVSGSKLRHLKHNFLNLLQRHKIPSAQAFCKALDTPQTSDTYTMVLQHLKQFEYIELKFFKHALMGIVQLK